MPMIRKRPHNKSRTGCSQCKKRKIKCDERKPRCTHCERYSADCDYSGSKKASVGRDEPPRSVSAPGLELGLDTLEYNVTDMALLHHWTVSVYRGFGESSSDVKGYQLDVPQLAFEYPFVLRAMLAISALHLARSQPERRPALLRRAAFHQHMALPSYRDIINDVQNKLNRQNCHAVLTFASLTTAHSLVSVIPTDEPYNMEPFPVPAVLEWLQLIRGCQKILHLSRQWLADGPMAFHLRAVAVDVDISRNPDDSQLAALKSLFDRRRKYALPTEEDEEFQALQLTLELLRESSAIPFLSSRTMGVKLSLYQWAGRVPEKYVEMLGDHKPEALIILAHVCVLLKKAACWGYWYCESTGERILMAIGEILPDEWTPWLAWPIEAVRNMRPAVDQDIG